VPKPSKTSRNPSLPLIDAGVGAEFDPWAKDYAANHIAIDVDGIESELKRILRRGLPLNRARAGDVLPNLRSIAARSVHPYDPQSRIAALNQQLARMLIEHEGDKGKALRVLFCVAKGTKGTTLTQRRERAAKEYGYEDTHFRKNIEAGLLSEFAEAIYDDLLRYKRRVVRALEYTEPTGDTPRLDEEHLTHEEELISRIWQHVYGLRAELIAQYRHERQPGYEQQAEEHRQAAGTEMAAIKGLVEEYQRSYGQDMIRHGEAEIVLDQLTSFVL